MIKVTLKIDGMACGMCESHINDLVRREFRVKKVTSSHTKGETVILCEDVPDAKRLKKAIDDTGYTLLSIAAEPHEKKGLLGFRA